jgi:hypothetical protein
VSTAEIEAARLLLQRLGVRPEDLIAAAGGLTRRPAGPARMPTIGEYPAGVSDAVSPATRQAYDTYWRRIVAV